jgi:hypothetical protein
MYIGTGGDSINSKKIPLIPPFSKGENERGLPLLKGKTLFNFPSLQKRG